MERGEVVLFGGRGNVREQGREVVASFDVYNLRLTMIPRISIRI
jgi:hypothetical protein